MKIRKGMLLLGSVIFYALSMLVGPIDTFISKLVALEPRSPREAGFMAVSSALVWIWLCEDKSDSQTKPK